MLASLRCVHCGHEVDWVVDNGLKIGEVIELPKLPCEGAGGKCGLTKYVRVLQCSISKHSSWSKW